MQDILNKKLKEEGSLYIEEILNEVTPFLSGYKSWQLEQSIIKDLDKKILCKRIFDENKELNGYKVVIQTEMEEYIFFILRDLISLEKIYCDGAFSFKEFKSIYNDNGVIKVHSKYQENTSFSDYTGLLNNDFYSFDQIINNLKIVFNNSKKNVKRK